MMLKKYHFSFIFLIVVIGSLIYSNSFQAEFQFDDTWLIVNNQDIKSTDNVSNVSNWLNLHYRMLSRLSFVANYKASTLDYRGYHLVNLLIHLLTGIFVYLLTLRLLSVRKLTDHIAHSQLIALFTALIFVSHPIQTQAVTYLSQRMTSMAALFYIISVYCYLLARVASYRDKEMTKSWVLGFSAVLLGIMSIYTKQTVITLPVAFILFELIFIRNNEGKISVRAIAIIATLISAGVILILLQGVHTRDDQSAISRLDYLLTQFRAIPHYFRLILLPYGQNIDHHFIVSSSFGFDEIVGLLINLGIIISGVILWLRKYVVLSFSIFWTYLALSVESSIFPIRDVFVEHRMYLPMFGVSLFIAQSTFLLFQSKRSIAIGLLVLTAATYGILTYQRNKVWQAPLSLWQDSVKKSPNKARPNNNLGHAYLVLGETDSALYYFEKAISFKPDYVEALNNKGLVLYQRGDYEAAVHEFQKAMTFKPDYAPAVNNVGLAWSKLGEYRQAVKYMKKAQKMDPNNPEIPYNMGTVYEKQGKLDKAESFYLKALTINSSMAKATFNLANVYYAKGNMDNAIQYYEETVHIQPNNTDALNNLGNIYYLVGKLDKARKYYKRTLSVDPDHKNAKENLELL